MIFRNIQSVIYSGDGEPFLVDAFNAHRLSQHNWSVANGYARTWDRNAPVSMHRMVFGLDGITDHRDRDRSNNTLCNLRKADGSGNARNSARGPHSVSKFRGVTVANGGKSKNPWKAQIMVKEKNIYLGSFSNELDAARARDDAARRLHGEFAVLNFPEVAA